MKFKISLHASWTQTLTIMHTGENGSTKAGTLSDESEESCLHETRSNPPDYQSVTTGGTTLANGSSSSVSAYTYQELPGGVMCPTCNGTGRIPRGQEDDLVALIPYRDDRLKPRRTKLYVFLSILLCGLVAGIMCAFLLTKPVHMNIHNISTRSIQLQLNSSQQLHKLTLGLEITYNISNSNFPSIYLKNTTVIGMQSFNTQPVVSNTSAVDLRVSGRRHSQFAVNVTAVFSDDYVPQYCHSLQSKTITVEFSSTLQYQLMAQLSSISSSEYVRVLCAENEIPEIG